MAHFAKIENGIVTDVIVVDNNDAPDESTGQEFIASIGLDGEWKQTSYNTRYVYDRTVTTIIGDEHSFPIVGSEHALGGTPFRGKYASIGDIYDAVTDTFTPPEITEIVTEAESSTPDGNA